MQRPLLGEEHWRRARICHRLVCLGTNLPPTCLFGHRVSWEMGREMVHRSVSTPRALLLQSQLKNKTRIPQVPDVAGAFNESCGQNIGRRKWHITVLPTKAICHSFFQTITRQGVSIGTPPPHDFSMIIVHSRASSYMALFTQNVQWYSSPITTTEYEHQ